MGGLGSGGWGKKKKKHRRTVESCWVLDVKDLSARGCLQPGLFSTCRGSTAMAGFSPSACAARPGGICISPGAATSLAKVVLAKAVPETESRVESRGM